MKKKEKKHSSLPSPAITHFPTPLVKKKSPLSDEEKIEIIADKFKDIMEVLGLDLTNDSLAKSPYRVAKMYVKEIFSGLNEANFPTMSFFENEFCLREQSNRVFTKVAFMSFCEHHFVPMTGFVYVAYLPKKKIIGISKIYRIVQFFSKRPQLQERLTAQIADCLAILLQVEDVAVSITAHHHCLMVEGIQEEKNQTITNVLRGEFYHSGALKQEFFASIRN